MHCAPAPLASPIGRSSVADRAGMLRRVCGPLVHQSYELPAFSPGADLAWLCMTPAQAQAHMARLLASINAANVALFGPLPDPPTKRVLLQNTVSVGAWAVACVC